MIEEGKTVCVKEKPPPIERLVPSSFIVMGMLAEVIVAQTTHTRKGLHGDPGTPIETTFLAAASIGTVAFSGLLESCVAPVHEMKFVACMGVIDAVRVATLPAVSLGVTK